MTCLRFPPLMSGAPCSGDAFATACQKAVLGCDAGLVCHNLSGTTLEAAIVFTPEVPLGRAMAMLPLCGVGFQNALGALAPPEVAVHLDWTGGILVNGASCGRLRAAASTDDTKAVPDWLVIGLTVPFLPEDDRPGDHPDRTALYAEGCAEVEAQALLEAWARHVLNQTARWESDGPRALHAEWRGMAHGIGETATQAGRTGTYLGVDEEFGMLLRDEEGTHLIPLTTLLESP